MNHEFQSQEMTDAGYPVDLNEQEYLAFNMLIARKIGTLRMQKPMLVLFLIYFVLDTISIVKDFLDTGHISATLVVIALVMLACGAWMLMAMPQRIRKTAKANYKSGNRNGYYGEISVTPYAIMKNIGDETITVPLNEHSHYIESRDFMAFTQEGQSRSIVLPARCMTPEMAAKVREAVFAPTACLERRVFSRMEAAATEPIARRDLLTPPKTLYTVPYSYTEKEAIALFQDAAMKQYFQTLPTISAMAIMAGLLLAILQEQVIWFPLVSLGMIFGYLFFLILQARHNGKKAGESDVRTHLSLTDHGVEILISPGGRRSSICWQGIERAVERNDCVEFLYNGGNIIRIPKRAIDDFEEFKRVVDTYVVR